MGTQSEDNSKKKDKKGVSLSSQILIGLVLGVFTGIFIGDNASPLPVVGKAYVSLIHKASLYYIANAGRKCKEYFKDNPKDVDALVDSAEGGSTWTIVYPSYTVVVPEPHKRAHAGLVMPLGDSVFADFVDDWLLLKKTSGFIDRLYNKWILGKRSKNEKSRWSVMRNVLYWNEEQQE